MTTTSSPSPPEHPVATVVVDTPLAHLDRPFEYLVPPELADDARPGARVKVRFAGRDRDGFVLERRAAQEYEGKLAPLRTVVSPVPVLSSDLALLARGVADRYAGTMADVLRLAVPPRHARAERRVLSTPRLPLPGVPELPAPQASAWRHYPAGPSLIRRLQAGESPSAAWTALPDAGAAEGWPAAIAEAVAATWRSGRGSIVVLPDHRDLDRLAAALEALMGPGAHVRLTADQGPERRWADWLRVRRGQVPVVIGSRAAAFAPVGRLGLALWWDDGDDLLEEPRAPYPHVREVLRERARICGAALVAGGYTRSVVVQHWVDEGVLQPVTAAAATIRARSPRVLVAGEGPEAARDPGAGGRLPSLAWRTAHSALNDGPVLVQVPRRGYLVGLSCQSCRTPVRCGACAGPMQLPGPGQQAQCRWCLTPDQGAPCSECGSHQRRSAVVGDRRTAEELGRAFPGVPLRISRAGQVLASVPESPALVVATPGAEPPAAGGYRAVLLLDGWALVDRAGLDASVEALRRWSAAAALCRPAEQGGAVVLTGVPPHSSVPAVEALVRWDSAWLAARDLAERAALGLPPVVSLAVLTGESEAVESAQAELAKADQPPQMLGPIPVAGTEGSVRLLARGRSHPGALADPRLLAALRALRSGRSARKENQTLRLQVDPPDPTG